MPETPPTPFVTDRPADLDAATLHYLTELHKTEGRSGRGVYLPGSGASAVWLGPPLAILALIAVVWLAAAGTGVPEGLAAPWQAGLTGAAVLLIIASARRFRTRAPALGWFRFIDALYLWEVSPDRVQATPIDRVRDVNGVHQHQDWQYRYTDVEIKIPGRPVTLRLHDKDKAEEVGRFVKALAVVRQGDGGALAAEPAVLGALARQLADGQQDLAAALTPPPLPRPALNPGAAAPSLRRQLLAPAAGVATAALGLLVFSLVESTLWEWHRFAAVAAGGGADQSAVEEYLRRYPDGRRSGQVRGLLEDWVFAEALREAEEAHSPKALLAYLADTTNARHRDEAELEIAACEEYLFRRVRESKEDLQPADDYLREFPEGGHAAAVREARAAIAEYQVFAAARRMAEGAHSPKALLAYLADDSHTRHRDEAEATVRACEGYLFTQVQASKTDPAPADRYLAEFPDGGHRDEVLQARNDLRFARAGAQADKSLDPEGLRVYLADADNTRHRDEATEQLAACDQALFARVPAEDDGDLAPLATYLQRFPAGKHAAEALTLLDDRSFARGTTAARDRDDPAPLREYLADARRTRHRDEATDLLGDCLLRRADREAADRGSPEPLRRYRREAATDRHRQEATERIAAFYGQALERIRERARAKGRPVDEKLFAGLKALADRVTAADTPVVTVGFKASHDELPKTEPQKLLEKVQHDLYVKQNATIKRMAEQSGDGTAILPLGEVFRPDYTRRRERLFLELLRRSFAQALGEDLLRLEPAAAGQAPDLEVAHHTFAGGKLYIYTTKSYRVPRGFGLVPDDPPAGIPDGVDVAVHGLLRGYDIDWKLQVPADEGEEGYRHAFPSAPANQLSYDRRPGDPAWAPYAILMHSAAYDMSSNLIARLGLPRPPTPRRFTFEDAIDKNRIGVVILSEQGELKPGQVRVEYRVQLEAGRTYVLDAESGMFDTFLELQDPGGRRVAFNDDRVEGQTLNARITFRAPADGEYRAVVSAFRGNGRGRFLLTVQY